MNVIRAVQWSDGAAAVRILDQRRLPAQEVYRDLRTVDEVVEAIATLAVRGAPAIGVAAAMGMTLALDEPSLDRAESMAKLRQAHANLRASRPTAVNLAWAVDRMIDAASRTAACGAELRAELRAEADHILEQDQAMCRRMGSLGADLIPDGARILTHCNTGALATAGVGTALAAVYVAAEQGKRVEVFVDETRPLLQGSRLTAWELARAGIPATLLVDGAAASLMARGRVDLCMVGADRIAANGDAANKIGTYGVAVSAHHHGVPFYVIAPSSTFDAATAHGRDIEIEERAADEVRCGFGAATAPAGMAVYNPAFDVTPASLITAIVSDRAVHRPPYDFRSGTS